jgi:hypothetical protein
MRFLFAMPMFLAGCWVTADEMLAKIAEAKGGGGGQDTAVGLDSATPTITDSGPTDTLPTTTTTGTTGTSTKPTPFECADEDLGSQFGAQLANGSTEGAANRHEADCLLSPGAPDMAYTWTAPGTGCWTFRLNDEGWNGALYVKDACEGTTEVCVDEAGWVVEATGEAVAGLRVTGGTSLLLVVDGATKDEEGPYTLDIQVGTDMVPDIDLGAFVGQHAGTNVDADTTFLPDGCPFASGADVLLSWTAPATGQFRFHLLPSGTTFDTQLSLHVPCLDLSLSCEDAFVPFEGGGEIMDATVRAGEQLIVRVAGYYDPYAGAARGDYLLEVSAL